jgi:outer membrane protein
MFGMTVMALTMLGAPLAAQTTAPKIAYVNSQKLIDQAPGAAEAKATLQKELASYKAQLEAMDDSLNSMLADFNAKSTLLSADAKQKRQDDLNAKQAAFQQRAQDMQTKAADRQNELTKPIMDKIQAAIADIRKADNYSVIFDFASMVAADPALDITDLVLARLKAPAAPTAGKN